ncbi:AMP-binding protein [Streptomyces sp. NA04227]|uniref:AMP-binding protein n=1 Tax=Streptomyces sp. NA04227 TaxID=2742136 RepID=UPI0015916D90|nr:AMP-binding protein [Streptomyces sp. NA04227]QKW10193.1 AMP-binding protein [Streptomyces sp. NA04227]
MIENLAQLIEYRRERSPRQSFGVAGSHRPFEEVADRAAGFAEILSAHGLGRGTRVALIGRNSLAYLTAWVGLQLAGAEAALVNSTYADDMLEQMLTNLGVDGVVVADVNPVLRPWSGTDRYIDASQLAHGTVVAGEAVLTVPDPVGTMPGTGRASSDLAGFIHTSGTTGLPKFCALSHEYHLSLGRFIADMMTIGPDDTVFAPLPLFHINPLGYGIVGGLVAGANALSAPRFSANAFWTQVRDEGVTAAILHIPPVEILKKRATREDAQGHRLRVVFGADAEFMERFQIPVGLSGYGSTEAAGLTHSRVWRRGEVPDDGAPLRRYAGEARHDVEWRLAEDGEIQVRGRRPHVLFDGYQVGDQLTSVVDEDGWFSTGDLGSLDPGGGLVFRERRAESIRVKGEFVPIDMVEKELSDVPGLADFALWKIEGDLQDDQVVLYTEGALVDLDVLRAVSGSLPAFMRPAYLIRVEQLPRDEGVGKVRRRQLPDLAELERIAL